jgi:glycosyltransferase involved in cell wall biosynthesis
LTGRKAFHLVIPRGFHARTGGFIYDRRIVETLRNCGWRVSVHELDASFPLPGDSALRDAASTLTRIRAGSRVVIDGLALGGMPDIAEREAARLRLIALIHHPLALETGLAEETAQRLREGERRALAAVSRVIVTSRTTARALDDYGVAQARIAVVQPGTDPAPKAEGSGEHGPHLLCVASLTQRKGHAVLLEALAGLRHLPWRLTCVGSVERDPTTAVAVRRQIVTSGLGGRVRLLGEIDESALASEYRRADGFVLASHYEGYGMVLAEALARGLPIVACAGGAVAETVPESAALLVPPASSGALRTALSRLIRDDDLRARLRKGAEDARRALPTWQTAAERFASALLAAEAT